MTSEDHSFQDTFEGCVTNPGLALCYAFYKNRSYEVKILHMYEQNEGKEFVRNVGGPFGSFNDFLNVHDDGRFTHFSLHIVYENQTVFIDGKDGSSRIVITYLKDKRPDLELVFKTIATEVEEMLIVTEPHENRITKKDVKYATVHITKLQEYEDAEEDGRMLKLPCKPGDTIYGIRKTGKSAGHFGAYPIKIKSLTQIIGYMEKNMIGDKVFINLTQAQELADQLTNEKGEKQ